MNCALRPAATEPLVGVTAIDVRAAVVTVKVEAPLIVPDLAVIVAVPRAILLAMPVVFTVAINGAEEDQVAVPERFCVVPLL